MRLELTRFGSNRRTSCVTTTPRPFRQIQPMVRRGSRIKIRNPALQTGWVGGGGGPDADLAGNKKPREEKKERGRGWRFKVRMLNSSRREGPGISGLPPFRGKETEGI